MLKYIIRIILICAFIFILFPSVSVSARDVSWYGVKEVNDGKKGGGAWIVNKLEGYYIGRAFTGDQLLQIGKKDQNYIYGLIRAHPFKDSRVTYKCGSIRDGIGQLVPEGTQAVDRYSNADIAKYNVCESHKSAIRDRSNIGIGFNCGPSVCVDGTTSTHLAETKCSKKFYYNLFTVGGVPRGYDSAGNQTANIHYRFTTPDGNWAVVRSDQLGWGYVQKRCIDGFPQGGWRKCESLSAEEMKDNVSCSKF